MKTKSSQKLNPTKLALSAAIVVATIIILTTFIEMLTSFSSATIIISSFYGNIGYSVTITGAFIGAIYAFVDTFILFWIFAWLYNKLL